MKELPEVAVVLRSLFDTHRHPDGREYTPLEISVATGGRLRPSHVAKLRAGLIANPTRTTMAMLADFFRASPLVFFDTPKRLPQNEEGAASQEGTVIV